MTARRTGLPTLMLAWLVALFAAAAPAVAQDVLPVPELTSRVIDRTATLQPDQVAAIESKLAAFEAESGPQIVVLMVPTTAPEDIAAYAQRVADQWKIGRREVGDGLLLVVAKDDRRVRIEVAKALEGAIPDLAARRIIDAAITPAFRAGDYAGGISAAVDQIVARLNGEALPAPTSRRAAARPGLQLDELAMFFFVGVPVLGAVLTGMLGRKLGSLLTAGAAGGMGWWLTASALAGIGVSLIALLLVGVFGIGSMMGMAGGRGRRGLAHIGGWGGGGGFGGGRGGGFGGGGFSSGGGGDFGGGGSSGSW